MKRWTDSALGMGAPIARRDFINGVAVALAGAGMAQAQSGELYPPLRTGLAGEYPEAIEELERVRSGAYAQFPVVEGEFEGEYDLVIVGGGISGLSAAYFWQSALGEDQKILILDNHEDFGGHAKRNEFHHDGKTYLGYGGTMSIATPYPYSYMAKQMLRDLGIAVERQVEFTDRTLETKYQLGAGMFFDKEHFLEDRLVKGNARQKGFFAQVPVGEVARKDLERIHGKNPDYLAGMSAAEKEQKLAKMSYQEYLLRVAGISKEAVAFFLGNGGRNNKRVDTTPALEAARRGSPGFNGLGLKFEEGYVESSFTFHFPDGNASIARLLVGRLTPAAVPGKLTMESVVNAKVDYTKLDLAGANVRIRLGSPVLRVENEAGGKTVRLAYRKDGRVKGVRGKNCILACYNSQIPYLLPEIPAKQKEALGYAAKVPMVYTNVLLRQWTAWEKLGVSRIQAPGMFHTNCFLDAASTVGGYKAVTRPEEPIVVHMVRNPNAPGLPRREQNRRGQRELLTMPFAEAERRTREQLARMLGVGGFDPAKDILAITLNRWPNGYAYTYDTLGDPDVAPELRPHVLGRQRCGRVTVANSDAGAAAFTNQAMDEAHRAVQELLVLNGLA